MPSSESENHKIYQPCGNRVALSGEIFANLKRFNQPQMSVHGT
jgi:hypothetical protein